MSDLLVLFAAAVARHPDRTALVDGTGREVSFVALHARAAALAAAWYRRGIRKGDRVLLAMAVNADLYAALAGLWSLGATVVLPEPAMGLTGLRHAARVTKPRAFCSSGLYGLLGWVLPDLWPVIHLHPGDRAGGSPPPHRPADTDIALISFTSGTGGAPKAIPRSHGFLSAQHRAIAPLLQSMRAERDLVAFPVFVLINLACGQTSVLPNWKMSRLASLDPARLGAWLRDQAVTRALLPPSLCEKLAQTPIALPLHTVFTGGGPVFPGLIDQLQVAGPHLRIVCVYGSTEAEPIAHLDAGEITPQDRQAMQDGQGLLVGRPVDDIRLRIEGHEIQVAGPHVNRGYLDPAHDIDNKVHDGSTVWHRTGDAGHLDAQGRLWLLGRVGSDVQIAGRRTYPFSIEAAASLWPGVSRCALMARDESASLVIEGDARHAGVWQDKAAALGVDRVLHTYAMPMDRRHGSKIDRNALRTRGLF